MSPVVDEDEFVSVLGKGFAELEYKRSEWAELGVGTGAGAFPIRAQAKRLEVHFVCRQYKLPLLASYSTLLFDESGSIRFAKVWAAKMTYYLDIYLNQDDKDYVFTDEDINGWTEPRDFTDWVDGFTKKLQWERVTQLRGIRSR